MKTTYAVQWKTSEYPDKWKFYSTWKDLDDTEKSMTAAKSAPGCLEARIIKRVETLSVLRKWTR